jgi:hypothetical protein
MKEVVITQDVSTPINIINIERGRDIPGGCSVVQSTLITGNIIPQGTPLSAPASGVRSVCKQGKTLAGSSTTVKKVATGEHNFKQGDFLCTKEGGLAYAISSITSSNGVDDITVGTAIEATTTGDFVYEAAAQSTGTTSAFKNIPVAVLGAAFKVDTTMLIQALPAYVACSVKSGVIGPLYLAYLKNIDAVAY